MSANSHKRTFRPTAISRCEPWFFISILTAKLGAGISGVAPNGHKRRHKEAIIPIESGLGSLHGSRNERGHDDKAELDQM